MIADSLSTWLGFWTSPAAPEGAMSPMELDGYLTGVVVSPDPIRPSRWLDRIWGENEPTFDGLDQLQTIIAALDAGFKQIEAKQSADYRPLFLAVSDKPNHHVVDLGARLRQGNGACPRTLELYCRR
jgi:uncharacterized protein